MDPDLWKVITAVGVVVGALGAVVFGYVNYRNTIIGNLPKLAVRSGILLDRSRWIEFQLDSAEGRPDWEALSVHVRHNWRRRRTLCDGGVLCPQRDPRMWSPMSIPFDYKDDVAWRHRLTYEPDTKRGIVLIHSDTPDCQMWLTIALSSRPSRQTQMLLRSRTTE